MGGRPAGAAAREVVVVKLVAVSPVEKDSYSRAASGEMVALCDRIFQERAAIKLLFCVLGGGNLHL